MKKILSLGFLFLVSSLIFGQVNFIKDDLNQALTKAKAEKKYIIVDVYADWCGWCKKMDATTFKDDEVSNFVNSNMVALKLNSDVGDGVEFARKYNVTGLPTIVYLDSKGALVRVAPGYKTSSQLFSEVQPYKLKRKNVNMSEYIDARASYINTLEQNLKMDLEDGSQIAKSFEMGKDNLAFEFDQYKASFTSASPAFRSKMDVFYLLGKEKFDQVQDKIKTQNLVGQFTKNQALYLSMVLMQSGENKVEVLQIVNEHSAKSKDVDLLETKAAAQFFVGDIEDAKATIKLLGKLYKKKKMKDVPSFEILKKLVYQV
jgi:thioredoxin-related protein